MVNNTQRIDRLEGEIQTIPRLINSEMEQLRSEINAQIHTINQNHGTLANEISTLSQTIQILNNKLTNPDLINPLLPNPQNIPIQNTPNPNTQPTEFLVFEDENEEQPVMTEEDRGNWRRRRLDLPVFVGADPDGWIIQAERYLIFTI
jgi:hypothetical protein